MSPHAATDGSSVGGVTVVPALDEVGNAKETSEAKETTQAAQARQAKQTLATGKEAEEAKEAKKAEEAKPTEFAEASEPLGQGGVVGGRHVVSPIFAGLGARMGEQVCNLLGVGKLQTCPHIPPGNS
jgi:hypothetical protein